MQVFVSFPDAGYPDVVFEAAGESLVADATQTAADEWGVDGFEFLEISFCGSVIPPNSRLMSHGVEAGSQLTASLLQVFGLEWFTDNGKREKLMQHLSKVGEQHLFLDTPSFATDGCFRFDLAWVQKPIEISFINPCPSITSAQGLVPYLLCDQSSVTKVDLTGLRNITSIGNNLLSTCPLLETANVSCLSNVTKIGDYFLSDCDSISTLDLGCLNNVTEIGSSFLAGCASLSTLDLRTFTNVTKIGRHFLNRCPSLATLDLGNFSNVAHIEDYFIVRCSSLSTLDLGSFSNVTEIGKSCLSGCPSLSTLGLGSFNNVTQIGDFFLRGCSSLSTIDLRSFGSVTEVGDYFMLGCSSLTAVDVNGLSPESEVRKWLDAIKHPP